MAYMMCSNAMRFINECIMTNNYFIFQRWVGLIKVLRFTKHIIGHIGDGFLPTVSKH